MLHALQNRAAPNNGCSRRRPRGPAAMHRRGIIKRKVIVDIILLVLCSAILVCIIGIPVYVITSSSGPVAGAIALILLLIICSNARGIK